MISYLNQAQTTLNFSSKAIVETTKYLNESAGKLSVDKYMDSIAGVGHRIKYGHDLSYLPEIFRKFGWEGVLGYFEHNLKDLMSPHGVPVPFAENIRNSCGLSYKQAIDWLSINIGDLISGSFSILHSGFLVHSLVLASYDGVFSSELLINASISVATKFSSLLWVPNPITLLSGIIDIGALAFVLAPILLANEQIPMLVEQSKFELIFAGSIKGILVSLALGVPVEIARHYHRFKNVEEHEVVLSEFFSRVFGLILSGFLAGCANSSILLAGSIPLLGIGAGVFTYFVSSYIYNAKFKDSFAVMIRRIFFKESQTNFTKNCGVSIPKDDRREQLEKSLDLIPLFV